MEPDKGREIQGQPDNIDRPGIDIHIVMCWLPLCCLFISSICSFLLSIHPVVHFSVCYCVSWFGTPLPITTILAILKTFAHLHAKFVGPKHVNPSFFCQILRNRQILNTMTIQSHLPRKSALLQQTA